MSRRRSIDPMQASVLFPQAVSALRPHGVKGMFIIDEGGALTFIDDSGGSMLWDGDSWTVERGDFSSTIILG